MPVIEEMNEDAGSSGANTGAGAGAGDSSSPQGSAMQRVMVSVVKWKMFGQIIFNNIYLFLIFTTFSRHCLKYDICPIHCDIYDVVVGLGNNLAHRKIP